MSKTKTLIYCSLFTALIAAGAFIKIPVPVVPFTWNNLCRCLHASGACRASDLL